MSSADEAHLKVVGGTDVVPADNVEDVEPYLPNAAEVEQRIERTRKGLALAEHAHEGSPDTTGWCPTCEATAIPMRNGTCGWCDTPLDGLPEPPEDPTVILDAGVPDQPAAAVATEPQEKEMVVPAVAAAVPDPPEEAQDAPEAAAVDPAAGVEGEDAPFIPPGPMLQLGPGFELPLDAATQSFGILAVTGAGKSNAAAVMAEEFFDQGIPFVVIDPKGDWWGIREGVDGHEGLSVVVFGGQHGDFPLSPYSGRKMAQIIYERNLTCVLDVSDMQLEEDQAQFMEDLGNELYELHKTDRPVRHIFLEEAQDLLPEGATRDQRPMLNAWAQVARKGRYRGLGVSLITQRTAELANSVFSQVRSLVVLRITLESDRRKIEGWFKNRSDVKQIVNGLAVLKNGEAWIVSPDLLEEEITRHVRFRRRWTYDSGDTPPVPEGRRAQEVTHDDLTAIGEELNGKPRASGESAHVFSSEEGTGSIPRDFDDVPTLPAVSPIPENAVAVSRDEAKRWVLQRLEAGPASKREIVDLLGWREQRTYGLLTWLRDEEGLIAMTGQKGGAKWHLPGQGPVVVPEAAESVPVQAETIQQSPAPVGEYDLDESDLGQLRAIYLGLLLGRVKRGDYSPQLLDRLERLMGFKVD